MIKIFKIAKFEFTEKVKTKTFLLFLIFFPLIILSISFMPELLRVNDSKAADFIGIIDNSEKYFLKILTKVKKDVEIEPKFVLIDLLGTNRHLTQNNIIKIADNKILEGTLESYFILNENNGDLNIIYKSSNSENKDHQNIIVNALRQIQLENKLINKGVPEYQIESVNANINLTTEIIGSKDGSSNIGMIYISTSIIIMMLFSLTLFSGGMLVRSLIEEKSNRIMEILLSSCTTNELLTGKILGLGMLGIFQIIIWSIFAYILSGSDLIPNEIFHNLSITLAYFILGYLFYTSIFVGIGAIVNTEQEAQQYSSYLSVSMLIPLILSIKLLQIPNSPLAKVLSYFPLTSAPIMIIRSRIQSIPVIEILLSIVLLLLSIYIVILISSKLFKIGILSYGKTPTIKEMINWVRES